MSPTVARSPPLASWNTPKPAPLVAPNPSPYEVTEVYREATRSTNVSVETSRDVGDPMGENDGGEFMLEPTVTSVRHESSSWGTKLMPFPSASPSWVSKSEVCDANWRTRNRSPAWGMNPPVSV